MSCVKNIRSNFSLLKVQYSWRDGDEFVFMNPRSFEEVRVPKDDIENFLFLSEGQDVKLMKFDGKIIGVELPLVSEFVVTSVDGSKTW